MVVECRLASSSACARRSRRGSLTSASCSCSKCACWHRCKRAAVAPSRHRRRRRIPCPSRCCCCHRRCRRGCGAGGDGGRVDGAALSTIVLRSNGGHGGGRACGVERRRESEGTRRSVAARSGGARDRSGLATVLHAVSRGRERSDHTVQTGVRAVGRETGRLRREE